MLLTGQRACYTTPLGAAYCGDSLDLLPLLPDDSVNLVMTSPPFALQTPKLYHDQSGNKTQAEYTDWLAQFGALVLKKLRPDGSLVLDIGGAYVKGAPERSLYPFRVLLKFCDELGFHLAQDFYWHNPSKLPSPAEWVTRRKIRAKDSVNTVWWLSKTAWPKADTRRVLAPYSDHMKKLLKNPAAYYTPATRPSGHRISAGFGVDNGGALPPNLLQIPNSESGSAYVTGCKATGIKRHPARFPARLPEFFIKFLTEPGDLVLDIFAGSNTTGEAAEKLGRKWLAFEKSREDTAASIYRFSHAQSDYLRALSEAEQPPQVRFDAQPRSIPRSPKPQCQR